MMRRWLAVVAVLGAAQAQAAVLKLTLMTRTDDPRLEARRVEQAYLGQPGGALQPALEIALDEAQFELDAAQLKVELTAIEVASADEARAQFAKLQKAGVQAVIADLPAPWLAAAASAPGLPVFNAGAPEDELRGAACGATLFHTLPSERMRADALGQALVTRKWSRVLLLQGPSAQDAQRAGAVQAALKRYGLKTVAVRPFKLSSDPRERDLANPLLLTGGLDYDAIWVVDSDGEFARALPYRTALPRPVVGDGGLAALAWAPGFERYGAPQLARRFARAAKRPMSATDWAAWMAAKAVLQAALENAKAPSAAALLKSLTREGFVLDGFKGVRLGFRAWDRQLRQPLLLSDGIGVIGMAPVEGLLHPKNVLDTLGADAPEALCKAKP